MKSKIDKEIRKQLASRHACFVLITCDSPSKEGNMHVEMTYEGDPVLAAYLLEGAQSYLAEMENEQDAARN